MKEIPCLTIINTNQ